MRRWPDSQGRPTPGVTRPQRQGHSRPDTLKMLFTTRRAAQAKEEAQGLTRSPRGPPGHCHTQRTATSTMTGEEAADPGPEAMPGPHARPPRWRLRACAGGPDG